MIGLILLISNYFIYQYSSFTLMIFTAVIISIFYIEMGIILSRNFFNKFFDDQLPKEIILLILRAQKIKSKIENLMSIYVLITLVILNLIINLNYEAYFIYTFLILLIFSVFLILKKYKI